MTMTRCKKQKESLDHFKKTSGHTKQWHVIVSYCVQATSDSTSHLFLSNRYWYSFAPISIILHTIAVNRMVFFNILLGFTVEAWHGVGIIGVQSYYHGEVILWLFLPVLFCWKKMFIFLQNTPNSLFELKAIGQVLKHLYKKILPTLHTDPRQAVIYTLQ